MNNSATYLLAALREKIKEKGICYIDISNGLDIPLSTVKRQLHNTALGLDKIISYAMYLDTDLVDLSIRAKKLQSENEQFISESNSAIFCQYPFLFDFLYLLKKDKQSLNSITETYNLSQQSLTIYLRALEMMGYVNLKGAVDYTLNDNGRFIFEEGSDLDTIFAKRFTQEVHSHDIRPDICVARIKITEEQQQKLAIYVYNKLIEFDVKNRNSDSNSKLKNILMSFTPGNQIFLGDNIDNVDGSLLRTISAIKEENN
ncbi:transcriptional regulator [Vibrio atypicus]|uniref:transcriptional regulator n=1 Tax=Vibrio atypicus TaxID=558271 RepID=UPI001357F2FA|nr:transcriptional regulator [Vibrio atypicus]